MRKLLAAMLIIVTCTTCSTAATIYLRDGTKIEGAKIVEELPEEFHVERPGENYSFIYKYSTVKKTDIFCVVGAEGQISYPHALMGTGETRISDFQAVLLQQQKEANGHLKNISMVMAIELFGAIVIGLIAAAQ